MKRSNIIITGTNGMLGRDILNLLCQEENLAIFSLNRNTHAAAPFCVNQVAVDLTDFALLKKTLKEIDPKIIIHCAAYVNVDDCELRKEYAHALHVEATEELVSYKPNTVRFIYISTDSVFDGTKGDYGEEDEPCPVNYYSKTKLEGEHVILRRNPEALIIRTNIYGFHIPYKRSLLEWGMDNLCQGKPIEGFTDAFFNPVYTKQLAWIIKYLLNSKKHNGILNVGSNEYISKYHFLLQLAAIFGFSESLIQKSSMDKVKFVAKRPKNSTLNIRRLNSILNEIPSLKQGLREFKSDYEFALAAEAKT